MFLYEKCPYLKNIVEQTGYKSLKSLFFLHNLVKLIAPAEVLELGTGYGCSAIFMVLANDTVKITSIDDYAHDFIGNNLFNVAKNIEKCGIEKRVNLINSNTFNILPFLNTEDKITEIVFMDASHNKSDLDKEYDLLKNALQNNHIIIVDDVFSENDFSIKGNTTLNFVAELSKKYAYSVTVPFHNGISILATNINKYSMPITKAIMEANNYE